jgi:hypothetical protein
MAREELLDAVERLRQAGLLAVHGTISSYGEAMSCPGVYPHGECECGFEEHNADVEAAVAALLQLLERQGIK